MMKIGSICLATALLGALSSCAAVPTRGEKVNRTLATPAWDPDRWPPSSCQVGTSGCPSTYDTLANLPYRRAGRYFTSPLDGLKHWYIVKGDSPKKPVMIFVSPGWGASIDLYLQTFGFLEEKYTVVYFDSRGAGLSDRPEELYPFNFLNFTNDKLKNVNLYDYQYFIDDIETLRQHLARSGFGSRVDKVIVAGQSGGTMQAMEYARQHAEHLKGIVLMSPYQNFPNPNPSADPCAIHTSTLNPSINQTEYASDCQAYLQADANATNPPSAQYPQGNPYLSAPWFTAANAENLADSQNFSPANLNAQLATMTDVVERQRLITSYNTASGAGFTIELPLYFYSKENAEKNLKWFKFAAFTTESNIYYNNSPAYSQDALKQIHVNTLIISGDSDIMCLPLEAQRIEAGIQAGISLAGVSARADLVVVSKGGHFDWLDNPDEFQRAFQYIDGWN